MKIKKMHLRMFFLLVIASASLTNATGQTLTKTFTFNFDAEDFRIEQIGPDRKCEFSSKQNYGSGELGEPNLPHIVYNILLPDNYRIHSFSYSVGDDTCRINRIFFYPTAEEFLNNNPDILTVDSIPLYPTPLTVSGPGPHPDAPQYPLKTFPTKVQHTGNQKWDNYVLERFTICPFTYYAVEQKLVLSTSFNLTVSIVPHDNGTPSHTGQRDEWIKEITYNLDDFGKGAENWTLASTETTNIHSFVNESKLWHCKKWKQAFLGQEDRYYYFQGDTVINGITAKKMYLKFSKESDKGNYQAALYEEGQKVYCCYPNQKGFELEYDFGAKKGEKVTTSSFTYMVEDVEEMKVGDETLRVLHLYILHDLFNEKYPVTWVEGVGGESAPCYSGPNLTGGYEYFIDCEIDGKVFLKAEDIPDPTPNTPVDMTSHIVNPNYDNNDNEGWSGTIPLFQTYTNAEHYNKTFDTWQDITDLPNGVYKLSVQGFYRPSNCGRWDYENGDTPQNAVFYAANGIDSLISPIPNIHRDTDDSESLPNNMQQAGEAFAAGKYVTTLHFVVSDHRVRIGIAQNEKAGDTDWVSWDNWQLTYYGNEGEASFNGAVKEMIDDNLTRFDTITEKISTGVVDAYKTTINNLTATDLASVNEAKLTIENAIDTVETNICAWEDYQKNVEEVIIFMSEYYEQLLWYDTSRKLYDYIQTEAPTYIEDLGLTTEKLLAQIAYLREMTNIVFIKGHPTKTVWSYVSFEQYTNESNEIKERNSYTRYLLDRGKWTNVGQASYHKLVEYTTCEYEEGQETNAYRIRWEGNRVYIHKEDAPDYAGSGIILKEEGDDYLLYDFNLNVGDEFCKWIHEGDTTSITVSEISFVTTTDGETFKAMRLSMGIGWWIEGFGSTINFLYYIFPDAPTCVCGSSLNYAHESTIHRTVATYKNPFGDITAVSTAFKADDCALGADAIENVIKEQESAQVLPIGQTLLCTSPTAVKLEVYTMDAIKVGEAAFANGKASVKVRKTPATYLYIVTYPDGRRESGKVVVKD